MPKVYTIEELKLTPEQTIFAEENIQLAYKLVSVWRRKYPFLDYVDIYDTVIHAFIKSVRTFDEEKGKFSTYIYYVTEREIHKYFRDINTEKRKADLVSIDNFNTKSGAERKISYHEMLGEPDKYVFEDVEWLRKASQALSERERRLIHMTIVQGISQKEVGSLEGISQMHVSRIVKQGLAKMRKYAEQVC